MRVAFFRGVLSSQIVRSQVTKVGMMAVSLSEFEVTPFLKKLQSQENQVFVGIGCYNSPKNLTLTGHRPQSEILKSWFDEAGIFARSLNVDAAYHSSYMNSVTSNYKGHLAGLEPAKHHNTEIEMISTVSTQSVSSSELISGDYWVKNMVSPVKFSQALSRLVDRSAKRTHKQLGRRVESSVLADDLLEVGSHPALQAAVRDIVAASSRPNMVNYIPTLDRASSETLDTFELSRDASFFRLSATPSGYKQYQATCKDCGYEPPRISF